MTLPYPIAASQVDAQSPVDDALMQAIKADLDALDTRTAATTVADYQWKLNGPLAQITKRKNRVDGAVLSKATTLSVCSLLLESGGSGGVAEVDLRRASAPALAITAVNALFTDTIQSVGRAGSSVSTQSVSLATPQIATQSVARYKATLNITSILDLGFSAETFVHQFKINLSGAPDADWTGRTVIIAGATASGNNGNFTCVRVKDDGQNNIVIVNASGAAQTTTTGTVDLDLMKYVYVNPVSSYFVAGESAQFAGHTNALDDGLFPIFAINQTGNNLIVANVNGIAQGSAAGNVQVREFYFATAAAVSATDYVAGESAFTQSHTSSGNNGNLLIKSVNVIGNGLVLYAPTGAIQAGAAGTIDTTRWIYAFASDPATGVVVGDTVNFVQNSSPGNNGAFVIKAVDRAAGTNLVVANTLGVNVGSASGSAIAQKKKVSLSANPALLAVPITTISRVQIVNCPSILKDDYDVLQVNRGGGSNYNIVIAVPLTSIFQTDQTGQGGRISIESQSVFDTRPSITVTSSSYNGISTHALVSTNAVLNSTRKVIPDGTLLYMDILSVPGGTSRGLALQVR